MYISIYLYMQPEAFAGHAVLAKPDNLHGQPSGSTGMNI
jgi:hypothetical protein